jgi:hypothetical protein
VNNAASTACPEDDRGRLASAVLDVGGSRQRLEDGLAQGRRRCMSDAATGVLGRSNNSFSLVWWREEQSGGKGADAGGKASLGGENGLGFI